jgi:hypothetical protein
VCDVGLRALQQPYDTVAYSAPSLSSDPGLYHEASGVVEILRCVASPPTGGSLLRRRQSGRVPRGTIHAELAVLIENPIYDARAVHMSVVAKYSPSPSPASSPRSWRGLARSDEAGQGSHSAGRLRRLDTPYHRRLRGAVPEDAGAMRGSRRPFSLDSRSTLGWLIRVPLRLVPDTAVVPILSDPLRGMRWIAGSAPHGGWVGTLEREKLRSFVTRLRSGMTVWDIGANVGLYTLLSARVAGPTGRVYAFEPIPRNLRFLRRQIALNGLTNVEVGDVG